MRYELLYTEKDVKRVTEGRFTANNLNNCHNINKFLARFAAAIDYSRFELAEAIDYRAREKFGYEWTELKNEYRVNIGYINTIGA